MIAMFQIVWAVCDAVAQWERWSIPRLSTWRLWER